MKKMNVFGCQWIIGEYIEVNGSFVDVWASILMYLHCFNFVLCSYSSLDRKSQKNRMKKQAARSINQPTKSTSLSNFNFINKSDDLLDTSPPANSGLSRDNEQRRSREKQW